MPLRRAGTVPNAGLRYGPGSAAHRSAKCYALRCVRGAYAVFRIALSTSVLPSDQIAPGTLWLSEITVSNARSIQLQSSSVMVSGGNSLMVWLPWPETWVRILWSLNSGTVMSWQNRPLLAVSSTFQDAFRRSDFGGAVS